MHDKGKGIEALTSLPKLISSSKINDYEYWLNFIMEASGINDVVDSLKVWFVFFFISITLNLKKVPFMNLFNSITGAIFSFIIETNPKQFVHKTG